MSLNEAGGEVPGGHAGVRHPHGGQGQVRHVEQRAAGQQVVAPPAVRVLSQEPGQIIFQSKNFISFNLKLIHLQHCRHRRVNRVMILLFVYAKQRGDKRFQLYLT